MFARPSSLRILVPFAAAGALALAGCGSSSSSSSDSTATPAAPAVSQTTPAAASGAPSASAASTPQTVSGTPAQQKASKKVQGYIADLGKTSEKLKAEVTAGKLTKTQAAAKLKAQVVVVQGKVKTAMKEAGIAAPTTP
jgi:PBP1b-binding outer membrane lipoprotein LpoB